MLRHCLAQGISAIPRREIQHSGPYAVRKGEALEAALNELEELGRVRIDRNGKQVNVSINPKLLRSASHAS